MKTLKQHYAVFTAFFVFIIYLTTLASTVIHLDVGELATVQSTLGIAHPTGYPLFTIVGYLFTKLLFPFRQIDVLNLLAAIYCALAVWVLVKLNFLVLNKITKQTSSKRKKQFEITEEQKLIASSVVGLIIGFSKTFWFQSTSVEVYSLHLFLMSLILFFTVTAYYSNEKKHWYFLAIFLALGFSNHMTTVLLIPGIAFLFFKQNGFNKKSFLLIVKMLLVFFPILILVYSYLPLRALQNPILNWGNPIDFERFIRHVSGKQYQVWIFSSFDAAKKQFVYFIESLPLELGYIGLVISLIGIPFFIKRSKTIAIFLLINFIIAVSYSINYDIADIDSYFLLAFVSLGLLSSFAIVLLIKNLPNKFYQLVFLIPSFLIFINYSNVDKSNNYVFEDYTREIINSAGRDGIIFSYQWDYFISPSYYFQYVENYRPDVAIIDKELLRRSWYYNQLSHNMPHMMEGIQKEVTDFLEAVKPFERDETFNAGFIEKRYRNVMTGLISSNITNHNFYITPELVQNEMQKGELQLPAGYTLVPMQYFFKVVNSNSGYIQMDFQENSIRFTDKPDYYEQNIKNFLSSMIVYRIMYELRFNNVEKAQHLYNNVKKDNPNYRLPPSLIQRFGNQ